MKALILAGGLGKRLRPVTEMVPKPLVPVLGRPVVEYTLQNLPPEVTEIIFVIGYKGEMIRERFGNAVVGRPVCYVVQEQQLGTGHAVKCARPLVREKFLLLYGDDVYGSEGLRRLVRHDWGLLCRRVKHPEKFGVVVTDKAGCVTRLVEKPREYVSDLTWVGAGVFQEDFLGIETPLSPRGEYEATDMFNVLIERGVKFRTELADLWFPGNTHEEIHLAEAELRAGT